MNRLRFLSGVALAFLVASSLIPARVSAQYNSPVTVHGGLGLSTTSYDRSAARQSNTVSRSFGFQSFVEPRLYGTVGFPITIGWEYLGPVCFNTSESAACFDRPERRTSAFFASIGPALYGPPIPLTMLELDTDARPFILVGKEWVTGGFMDADCITCYVDGIDFDGGVFMEPGFGIQVTPDVTIGVGYRVYKSRSDLENRLVVRIETRSR